MSESEPTNSPADILAARLEELRLIQEPQQRTIIEKQFSQRELLNQEQMDTSGMGPPVVLSNKYADNIYICSDAIQFFKQNNVDSAKESNSKYIIKHKYLKRGEGLTSRFKINPEALRLNNIPKYKFSNVKKQKQREMKKRKTLKLLKIMELN